MESEKVFQIVREEAKKLKIGHLSLRIVRLKERDCQAPIKEFSKNLRGLGFWEIIKRIRLFKKAVQEAADLVHQQTSGVRKDRPGVYMFYVNPEGLSSKKRFRRLCRHELYHIAAGHCDMKYSFIKNIILDIPAMIYEFFGIRV